MRDRYRSTAETPRPPPRRGRVREARARSVSSGQPDASDLSDLGARVAIDLGTEGNFDNPRFCPNHKRVLRRGVA